MMRNSNVVELKPKSHRGGADKSASGNAVRLPQSLAKLRVRCGTHLKKLMARFFERIDDTFFDLADQAASNSEQSSYFDAMREIRMKRGVIAKEFLEAYQRDFEFDAEVLQDVNLAEFDTQNLAVVQNDELEEQVAIENIIGRIKSEVGQDLDHLTQRFDALLPTIDLHEDRNPVGAHRLAKNFATSCQALDLDIRSKLVLYKIFEKQVLSQVKSMLAAANKFLAEQGVLPDLSVVRKTPENRSHNRQYPPVSERREHVIDAETGVISHVQSGLDSDQTGLPQPDPMAMIAQVQALMPAFNPEGVSMSLPVLRQPSLMNALSVAQNAFIQDVEGSNSHKTVPVNEVGLIDFVNLMQRMIKGKDGSPRARIDQADQDAINLVTMLFDFILEDRQLQAPIKAILGRLQIPLVKVALVDKTFFKQGGHVARRLLNELAMASVGWTEKENGVKDTFLAKLENSVLKIVNEFNDDITIFHEVLTDFQLFQEAEKKRRVLVEQRTRDSEEGRAKTEAAKRWVQNILNKLLDGQETTAFVLELLREGWSSYMVLLNLKYGAEHSTVVEAEQIAALLIAAASPERSVESLTFDAVDDLVLAVKKGLVHAAYLPHELDKRIDELQAYLLTNIQEQPPANTMEASEDDQVDKDGVEISEQVLLEVPVNPRAASQRTAESLSEEGIATPPVPVAREKVAGEFDTEGATVTKTIVEKIVTEETATAERASENTAQSNRPDSKTLDSLLQKNQNKVHVGAEAEANTISGRENKPTESESKATKSKPVESKSPENKSPEDREPEDQVTGLTLAANPKIVLLKDEPEIRAEDLDQRSLVLVEKLGIGNWIEIRETEGKHYRCKLAAIINSIDKFIFVNRMGVKVAEKSKSILVQQVSEGTIQLLDDGLLFDRALESVITTLRK